VNPKQLFLRATRATGVNAIVANTPWRRHRLLILCYHGVSLRDEHLADPALYVSPAFFRQRLERLERGGFNVLRLADAISRMRDGSLPPKSVVLTFDDGTRDFAELVVPMLREFEMPATVYVTTYYCENPLPVFDTSLRYLLWRGRSSGKEISQLVPGSGTLPLATDAQRDVAWRAVYDHAKQRGMTAAEKQNVLASVAEAVGVDFADFMASGAYQQMTPAQVRALPRDLIDVELHTHRHRTPRVHDLFAREIVENRALLSAYTGNTTLEHFCYPSGDYWGEFVPWLRELGVESATTCVPGLATTSANPMLLPRFLDSTLISDATFDAWTSGIAELLPRRAEHQFEETRLSSVSGASTTQRPSAT
jgi:peptidoglycan/xylan/chitin deacetylase (PgdA/CDA1 family)